MCVVVGVCCRVVEKVVYVSSRRCCVFDGPEARELAISRRVSGVFGAVGCMSESNRGVMSSLLGRDTESGGITDSVLNAAGGSKECCGFKLSWKQRFYGWLGCFITGVVVSFLASLFLFFQEFVYFIFLVTIGNMTSLLSSLFLIGPWEQIKKMFKETRVFATIAVLVFMILTIMASIPDFFVKPGTQAIIPLLFLICQELALTWYMLTWIPGARMAIKKCCKSALDMD